MAPFWGAADALGTDTGTLRVCVLYPDVSAPYEKVFREILQGIQESVRSETLCTLALQDPTDSGAVKAFLTRHTPQAIVTLGRVATRAYEASVSTLPQVIGALDVSPQTRPNASGIGLAVEPDVLFGRLLAIAPTVKRVLTVYDPRRDEWVMDRARKAAAARGLALHAETAASLIESAPKYGDYVRTARSGEDAIWLTWNSALVDDPNLLSYLIQQGWLRRLILFSNTLEHAEAGVLFAPYPDTEGLGQRLGKMALRIADAPGTPLGIETLREVKIAINARIARHLGILGSQDDLHQFDQVLDATGGIE